MQHHGLSVTVSLDDARVGDLALGANEVLGEQFKLLVDVIVELVVDDLASDEELVKARTCKSPAELAAFYLDPKKVPVEGMLEQVFINFDNLHVYTPAHDHLFAAFSSLGQNKTTRAKLVAALKSLKVSS